MGRAGLAALLLAGAAAAASAAPRTVYLAFHAPDSADAAERLRDLAERFGGRETTREPGHIVKPISHCALLLPAARLPEFEKAVTRRWPGAALEHETPADPAADAARARRRERLAAAADELGRFDGQLPTLAAYVSLRAEEARATASADWVRVIASVIEDPVAREDLLVHAKGNGLRRREAPGLAGDVPAELSRAARADVEELRAAFGDGAPAAEKRRRLRALDAEAREFAAFLKERPALTAVLAEARRELRPRIKP